MTVSASFRIQDDKIVRRVLSRMSGKEARKAINRGAMRSARPIVKDAKRLAPKVSGNLRASLGAQRQQRGETVVVSIGPRIKFQRVSKGIKRKFKLRNDGPNADQPSIYGRWIELGTTKTGKVRRKAGGALYLTQSFRMNLPKAPKVIAREILDSVRKFRADIAIPPTQEEI